MYRKGLGIAVLLAAGALLVPTGASSAGRGVCSLTGVAKFTPGLTTTAGPFSYTFSGSVANCKQLGAIKSGTVTASGSGTGSCAGNQTNGTATVRWNTGATSSVSFTTNGEGPVIPVTGTITAGQFKGKAIKLVLAFYTTSPQKCATTGLGQASFAGPATLGV